MRMNNKQNAPIQLHGENIRETGKLTYLGSTVSKDGGADDDVKSHTNKARHVLNTLPKYVIKSTLHQHQSKIFNTDVKSVMLYMVRRPGR